MGPEHVELGIDLVYDVKGFTCFFEANKEKYWADNGKPLTAFLQPEQLREVCLLYTSPSPRDGLLSRMPSSA